MSRIGPLFQGSTPSHDYGYVDFGVDFELETELAAALEKYHRLAAERAQRLSDQVDRSLLCLVNPLTQRAIEWAEFPENLTPILSGPYQNAAEWNPSK